VRVPVCSADGERGVAHALAIVRDELRVAMSLTGVTDVALLDHSALVDPPGA